jgi:Raf kinase inhibitor-like YbhB/YbcL family protein
MPNPLGRALRNRRAGQHTLVWARSEVSAPSNFALTSPVFVDGAPIPERHRGHLFAEDLSPALAWTPPPEGTRELVLIVEDPDVPGRSASTHLLAAGIDPALGGLPEAALAKNSPVAGLRHGKGALGHRGWAGPMPIPSHGPHFYVFQLFAADEPLDLPDGFRVDDALRALRGHVLGRARLDGTYEVR